MKRAEAVVKKWLSEQEKSGYVARADQAPAWRDYQREYDKFNAAIAQIEST
jgi:hypothetical protein